jgi:hypothetical protein
MEMNTPTPTTDGKIIPHNMLLVFPSWESVIGYGILGRYSNKPVSKINSDPIIFLTCAEYTTVIEGEIAHCLFGLGYYQTQFEIGQGGALIEDNRILTGLILSDFAYDHIASSSQISLTNNPNITIAEKIIRIPFNLQYESEENKTFIKGVLMHNLFAPHKGAIVNMLKKIRQDQNFDFNNTGHLILSTLKSNFDNILVSSKINSSGVSAYMNSTAGISLILPGAEQFLSKHFPETVVQEIAIKLEKLFEIFSNLDIDEFNLVSLLERGSIILKSELPESEVIAQISSSGKAWILHSAKERISENVPWPVDIPRNKILEDERKKKKDNAPIVAEVFKSHEYDLGDYSGSVQTSAPTYKITSNVNPKVPIKLLPQVPSGNIEEILKFILNLVEEDYDMKTMASGFDLGRENLRRLDKSADYVFELSKMVRIYGKQPLGLGLSARDKEKNLEKANLWYEREVNKRLEAERNERERLEAEEQERIRIKHELMEKERQKKEFMANKRLEQERIEQEEQKRKELEAQRLEEEKLEQERLDAERIKQEEFERERLERERIEREGSFEYKIQSVEEDLKVLQEEQIEWKVRGKELKKEIKVLAKKLKKLQKAQVKFLK